MGHRKNQKFTVPHQFPERLDKWADFLKEAVALGH
jgi:hypothetical protein